MDEISKIEIKDKEYLKSGEKIGDYIQKLSYIEKRNFNKCDKCRIKNNLFYCESCSINLCDNCYKIGKHYIINLNDLKKYIDKYKKEINEIIVKNFIEPEKKDEDKNELPEKTYEFFDKEEVSNDKIISNSINNINDILLI